MIASQDFPERWPTLTDVSAWFLLSECSQTRRTSIVMLFIILCYSVVVESCLCAVDHCSVIVLSAHYPFKYTARYAANCSLTPPYTESCIVYVPIKLCYQHWYPSDGTFYISAVACRYAFRQPVHGDQLCPVTLCGPFPTAFQPHLQYSVRWHRTCGSKQLIGVGGSGTSHSHRHILRPHVSGSPTGH